MDEHDDKNTITEADIIREMSEMMALIQQMNSDMKEINEAIHEHHKTMAEIHEIADDVKMSLKTMMAFQAGGENEDNNDS